MDPASPEQPGTPISTYNNSPLESRSVSPIPATLTSHTPHGPSRVLPNARFFASPQSSLDTGSPLIHSSLDNQQQPQHLTSPATTIADQSVQQSQQSVDVAGPRFDNGWAAGDGPETAGHPAVYRDPGLDVSISRQSGQPYSTLSYRHQALLTAGPFLSPE